MRFRSAPFRAAVLFWATALFHPLLPAEDLEPIGDVEAQPLIAQVKRVEEALRFVGSPLSPEESTALARAYDLPAAQAPEAIQKALAPHVLIAVDINPES